MTSSPKIPIILNVFKKKTDLILKQEENASCEYFFIVYQKQKIKQSAQLLLLHD
jgi:hypothetical protein